MSLFFHLSTFFPFLDYLTCCLTRMCPTISMCFLFRVAPVIILCLSGRILFLFVLYIYQSSVPLSDKRSTQCHSGPTHFLLELHLHVLQCFPGLCVLQYFIFLHYEEKWYCIFLQLWLLARTCFLDVLTYQAVLRFL